MASCAQHTSCASCMQNSSGLCHFCADGRCHAYGSVYGCAVGTGCYQFDCMRTTPESASTQTPTFGEVLGIGMGLLFICCCALTCVNLVKVFRDSTVRVERQRDTRYISMSSRGNSKDEEDEEDPTWLVPQIERRKANPVANCCLRHVALCCGTSVLVATIVAVLIIAFFPHYPRYELCNSELDWSSLLDSAERFAFQADYDVVVSAYNPNQFDMGVEALNANIKFQGSLVATVEHSEPVKIPASTIVDVVVRITFRPSVSEALAMRSQYRQQRLSLVAGGSASGYFTPFGWQYSFARTFDDHPGAGAPRAAH